MKRRNHRSKKAKGKDMKDVLRRMASGQKAKLGFILLFATVGAALLLATRAATPVAHFEAENGTLSGASKVADSSASGGQFLQFSSGTTEPEPDPDPGEIPTKQWIIDNAGPTNPGALQSSGSMTITQEGAVVENVDVNGTITIKANNVTVRNCKVRGYSSVNVIRVYPGFRNTTVEHCRVEAIASSDGAGVNGAIGSNGSPNMTVRYTEVLGYGDGIKAEDDSLYEYNYIHMFKPAGSGKHLDGIQGSGDTRWTARFNVLDLGIERGGNFSLFAQAWNGSSCIPITDIEFYGNYIYGGNYGFSFAGGKEGRCTSPSDPSAYITNVRAINNIFVPDPDKILDNTSTTGYRYGYYSTNYVPGGELTISGNKLEDGRLLTGTKTPL